MLTVTNQIKAARALLGWNQFELCERAGVSISTVRRLEASEGSDAALADQYARKHKERLAAF